MAQWLADLLPDPAAPDSIPSIPQKISEEKLFQFLRKINGAGKRKVERGFKS